VIAAENASVSRDGIQNSKKDSIPIPHSGEE
jgi:hypothetical protein